MGQDNNNNNDNNGNHNGNGNGRGKHGNYYDDDGAAALTATDDDGGTFRIFFSYRPSTVDPGRWPFAFCASLCVILVGLLPLFLSLRKRRRRRGKGVTGREEDDDDDDGVWVGQNQNDNINNNNDEPVVGATPVLETDRVGKTRLLPPRRTKEEAAAQAVAVAAPAPPDSPSTAYVAMDDGGDTEPVVVPSDGHNDFGTNKAGDDSDGDGDGDDHSRSSDQSDGSGYDEWNFTPMLEDFEALMNGGGGGGENDDDDDSASDRSSVMTDQSEDNDGNAAGWLMVKWNTAVAAPRAAAVVPNGATAAAAVAAEQRLISPLPELSVEQQQQQQEGQRPPPGVVVADQRDGIFIETGKAKKTTRRRRDGDGGTTPPPPAAVPWYCFYFSRRFRRSVRRCAAWDDEMGRIAGLAVPFTAHTILANAFYLFEIGVMGRLLGSSQLSAYFAVEFALDLLTMFLHGMMSSLTVLVSAAVGAGNLPLAGGYVQVAVVSWQVAFLPVMIFGWDRFGDVVALLGFDDETTADAAANYARFAMLREALAVNDCALHYVLNVVGHEIYSAILNGLHSMAQFVGVYVLCTHYNGGGGGGTTAVELWMVGAVHLALTAAYFLINVGFILRNGWFKRGIWRGIFGGAFRDLHLVRRFFTSASFLSLGYVIENCEWQVLFLFAAQQGPAEVAVWGLVGALWQSTTEAIMAVCNASRIRVATLLGSGRPELAKHSSQKSFFWVTVIALAMSASIYSLQGRMPLWLTDDETLQRMFRRLMPLVSLGVFLLSMGTMTWAIMSAQGRGPLAIAVNGLGNVLVTLPLAAVSTFLFDFNLRALVACIIVGGCLSDFVNALFMLTSNWKKISAVVTERNRKRDKRGGKKLKTDGGRECDDSCSVATVIIRDESQEDVDETLEGYGKFDSFR